MARVKHPHFTKKEAGVLDLSDLAEVPEIVNRRLKPLTDLLYQTFIVV